MTAAISHSTNKVKNDKKRKKSQLQKNSEETASSAFDDETLTKTKTVVFDSNQNKSHVDPELIEKAVTALMKYHEKQGEKKGDLLGNDDPVQVLFTLEIAPINPSPRPERVMIPHPIHLLHSGDDDDDDAYEGTEEPDVCLIVKDGAKEWIQEYIQHESIGKHPYMKCIKKVLEITSLKKKHGQFQQQRELHRKYTVFLADDRVIPMLHKALGKPFFKGGKKVPVPIKLTRKEALPFTIHNALKSTFFSLSEGKCVNVRAGFTGMPLSHVVENVVSVSENAVQKFPKKWSNVRSIAIKTPDSMSLPIYNKTPEELYEIALLAGKVSNKRKLSVIEGEKNEESGKSHKKKELSEEEKKKIAEKSPLLRALKKQKKEGKGKESVKKNEDDKEEKEKKKEEKENDSVMKDEEEKKEKKEKKKEEENETVRKEDDKEEKKDKKEKKKKRKSKQKEYDNEEKEIEKSSRVEEIQQEEIKTLKKKQKEEPEEEEEKDDMNNEEINEKEDKQSENERKKKDKKEEDENSNKKEKEEHKEQEDKSDKKKKKKKKRKSEEGTSSDHREETSPTKKVKKDVPAKKEENEEQGDFLASKKFKGSKAGYVFQRGSEGLGYYKDVKPIVDRMALEAFSRLSSNSKNNSAGKGKRGKKGGRRNRR